MLPTVPGVEILSITKPKASKDLLCAWENHTIPKGRLYVRAVWKDRRQSKDNPVVNCDHICVECWTKD